MAVVPKNDSKLADSTQHPQLGEAQDALANVVSAGESSANLIARLNDVLDVLRYHGLIKE
jgi:hypothetical protein